MTDYTDLKARLRRADEYEPLGHDAWEAAAAIEALQAEVARLRGETQPNEVTAPTSGG